MRNFPLERYLNLMLLLLITHVITGVLFFIFPFGLNAHPFSYVGQLNSIIYITVKWLILDFVGIVLCRSHYKITFFYTALINLELFIYNKEVSAPIFSLFNNDTLLIGRLSVGLQLAIFILSLAAIITIIFDHWYRQHQRQ